jgi:Tfp pilus assembly protein PilN
MKDINFLPDEMKFPLRESAQERPAPRRVPVLKIIGLTALLLIAAAFLVLPSVIANRIAAAAEEVSSVALSQKYAQVKLVKSQAASVEALIRIKKDILYDIDSKSQPATEVLNAVKQALPKGCYLESVNYGKGSVKLEGYADSSLMVAEFITNLDMLQLISREGGTDGLSIEKANYPCKFSLSYKVSGKKGE